MRIAVISDVHSNLPALEAALEDITKQRADRIICCGDIVGYGPYPDAVVDRLRSCTVECIMGNYDEAVAFDFPACGCFYNCREEKELNARFLAWTKEHTSEESKLWLSSLPDELRFAVDGQEVLAVHGSPSAIGEYLTEDAPADVFDVHAVMAQAEIILFGHTHLPYHKQVRGVHFINAGSVGKPKDGDPRACYALVDLTGGDVQVDFRWVEYDLASTVEKILVSDLPRELISMLEKGTPFFQSSKS